MKKLFTAITIASSLMIISCSGDRDFKKYIEEESKKYPMEILPGFTLESLSDDGENVKYRYVYTDSLFSPAENLSVVKQEKAADVTLRTLRDNASTAPFFEKMYDAGRGLTIVYVARLSGDSTVLQISADDVQRVGDENK